MNSGVEQRVTGEVRISTPEGGALVAQIVREHASAEAIITLNITSDSQAVDRGADEQTRLRLLEKRWDELMADMSRAPASYSAEPTHVGSVSTQLAVDSIVTSGGSYGSLAFTLRHDATVGLEAECQSGDWPVITDHEAALEIPRPALDAFLVQVQSVLDHLRADAS